MSEVGEALVFKENPLPENISYVREGARFIDIVSNSKSMLGRENRMERLYFDCEEGKNKKEEFSEAEGLRDLAVFLDQVEQKAKTAGNKEQLESVRLFRENLVYVGEKELQEAVVNIAAHFVKEARSGKAVAIYYSFVRSEKYISLRVMEEVDKLLAGEELPNLRLFGWGQKRDQGEWSTFAKDNKDNLLMAVMDDFICSGCRIQGHAERAVKELTREGFSEEEAAAALEANLVCIPVWQNYEKHGRYEVTDSYRSFRVRSYFGAREYRGKDGTWVVYPGVSISGSHSSVDYGFEQAIMTFNTYLTGSNRSRPPLLCEVTRCYRSQENSNFRFADPALQRRWEIIETKYGFN